YFSRARRLDLRAYEFDNASLHAPAPSGIYTLSLHDALPIYRHDRGRLSASRHRRGDLARHRPAGTDRRKPLKLRSAGGRTQFKRSEEHTSELQSRENLVCRLLLEKKKNKPQPLIEGCQPKHD